MPTILPNPAQTAVGRRAPGCAGGFAEASRGGVGRLRQPAPGSATACAALRRARGASACRGFTLIEVLLAIGIAAGILMVVLFFYRQSEDLRTSLLQETSRISAARLIMQRLTRELGAARVSATLGQGLSGGSDNLRFVRLDFPPASAWTVPTNMFSTSPPQKKELAARSSNVEPTGSTAAELCKALASGDL